MMEKDNGDPTLDIDEVEVVLNRLEINVYNLRMIKEFILTIC